MLQLSIVYRLKGFLLATSLLLTIVSLATAQGSYQLNINHLMDGQKFAFKQNTYNFLIRKTIKTLTHPYDIILARYSNTII